MRASLLATFALAVLAACAGDGADGPGDAQGDDGGDPIEPGQVEGIEEASEALIDLSAQCTYTPSSGQMTLFLDAGDLALIKRAASGAILINGYECDGAVATKLTQLAISQGTSGDQTLILDYTGGAFGLGKSGAPGITVDLGADLSVDAFKVIGSSGVDAVVLGQAGMTVNGDGYLDVTVSGADQLVFNLGDGNDTFSGAGSAVAGSPATLALEIYGGTGTDTLRGGAGDDVFFGGEGNDLFTTGAAADGGDTMNGGGGTDTADYSGRGADLALSVDGAANDGEAGGAEGDDIELDVEVVRGGSGDDTLSGGPGSQTLYGGPGDDVLAGGPGNDTLSGDAGADRLDEGSDSNGADILGGGAGVDRVDYSARSIRVTVTIDALAGDGQSAEGDKVGLDVEDITGGAGNDHLIGSAGANVLVGGDGDDTLEGLGGGDTLRGGVGSDTLDGGAGDDWLDAEATPGGADTLRGGAGIDLADYSARSAALDVTMDGHTPSGEAAEGDVVGVDVEDLRGGSEGDALRGNALDNQIEGGGGDDILVGLAGDDVLDGDDGDDVIDCGTGDADILLDPTTTSALGCEL